ncbi:hypothetical protein VP03_26870 [Sinorhizobium meliloti]|nr:hypothetical protein VP03_26870 [Sinorhizobium meliloti]
MVGATQLGYGLGLVLLVPVGDLVDRRKLVIIQSLLSVLALLCVGFAPTEEVLFPALIAMGFFAVATQAFVAYAASLARPEERGAVVGTVTSGIVLGILLARTVAGAVKVVLANRRTGPSRKTVLTGTSKMTLTIPRDRAGTFDPKLIAKYQRRFP